MTSSMFTPGAKVKTLRSIGSWPAGTVGTVKRLAPGLLSGWDCYVQRDGTQSGMCFKAAELEPLS